MSAFSTRRVVITGVGLISPLGNTKNSLWDSLTAGRSGVARLQSISNEHLPISCGAEAREFSGQIEDFGELDPSQKKNIRKGLKVMCREIQMGVAAAQRALNDAGLRPENIDCDRTGCVFGSDYIMTLPEEFSLGIRACTLADGFELSRWAEFGLPKVAPLWLLKYLPNMPASHVAIYNDLRGPSNSITVREASANLAIGEAFCTIVRGSADVILAGATGTRIHPLRTLHVVMQEEVAREGDDPALLSRPFDLRRKGSVLGEGAGVVVLEELEKAQARGASILGEVVGYGSSARLRPDGVAERDVALENALRHTLRVSRLTPEQVGHVHAHGVGTRSGDVAEAQAIQRVFGARSSMVPVVAGKSYFGNLGAGGGIVELISSLLAMHHGRLFPILNYEVPDPACPLRAARAGDPAGDSFVNVNVTPLAQASAVAVRRYA